jgi:LIVCS family branched-chain amino acid:cation transporter
LNWLGKVLTPALLVCLVILFVKVLLAPAFTPGAPQGEYLNAPFLKGFQEGYNTMDLLASFLFGAATLTTIKTFGIENKKVLVKTCLWAGLITAGLLAFIYYFLGYAGAEAHRYLSGEFSNGAGILVATAHEYLGSGGTLILSAIIILACLTTSIGLIAAISDYFHLLFNKKLSKQTFGILIALLSFSLSNFGLDMIIKMAIPILCFLYPVMIALALLNVFGFGGNKRVFRCTMWIVTLFAIVEGLKAAAIPVPMESILSSVPLYDEGFGWFTTAVMGAAVGVIWDRMKGATE